MLVLGRKRDERIVIDFGGQVVEVLTVEVRGDKVRLGFEADSSVRIHRREVWDAIEREKQTQGDNDANR